MKRTFLIAFIVLVACALTAAIAFAEGIMTSSTRTTDNGLTIVDYTFVANAASVATIPSTTTQSIDGYIFVVVTNPGATAPTANYDITLTDDDGIDIMGGALTNRSATDTESACPDLGNAHGPKYVDGALTIAVSNNAVNSASGVISVYIAPYPVPCATDSVTVSGSLTSAGTATITQNTAVSNIADNGSSITIDDKSLSYVFVANGITNTTDSQGLFGKPGAGSYYCIDHLSISVRTSLTEATVVECDDDTLKQPVESIGVNVGYRYVWPGLSNSPYCCGDNQDIRWDYNNTTMCLDNCSIHGSAKKITP